MTLKTNQRGKNSAADRGTPIADNATDKTPNDMLAEEISEALASAGLVPENRKTDLLSKLKIGGVKQEDWSLWVDVATTPKQTGVKNHE